MLDVCLKSVELSGPSGIHARLECYRLLNTALGFAQQAWGAVTDYGTPGLQLHGTLWCSNLALLYQCDVRLPVRAHGNDCARVLERKRTPETSLSCFSSALHSQTHRPRRLMFANRWRPQVLWYVFGDRAQMRFRHVPYDLMGGPARQ